MANKLSLMALTLIILVSGTGFSQSTIFGSDETQNIQGLLIGGLVRNDPFGTNMGAGARYWHEYFGGDFAASFYSADLEDDTGATSEFSVFSVGFSALAGFPIRRFKPHLSVGYQYDSSDIIFGGNISQSAVRVALGVDFLAGEHFVLGVDTLDFSYILDADFNNTGTFSGSRFGFFNALRVYYKF
ncbi:MAG: hypothetical protein KDD48_05420 [Bdellovibrionales bacterium]|nr:hypothetical protein [Bdellovibrionales bacterium]